MMINCLLLLLCYYGKLPVANITESINQQCNRDKPIKWTELTAADHALVHIALVPSSSPLIVIGGEVRIVWLKVVYQQQVSRCMTTLTSHGGRLDQ